MPTNTAPPDVDWIIELAGANNRRAVRASYVSYAPVHDGIIELKDSGHRIVFTAPLANVTYVQRIGTTSQALTAVAEAIRVADDEDVTDWQRGYRACADRVTTVLQAANGGS
jgi:hypothetical protein